MSALTFTLDPAAVKQLAHGEQVHAFVNEAVQRVLNAAQENAPVHGVPEYRPTLGSTPAEDTADTVQGEVWSSSSFWHLVEFGSIHNGAYHVLERAVTDAGLEFQPR